MAYLVMPNPNFLPTAALPLRILLQAVLPACLVVTCVKAAEPASEQAQAVSLEQRLMAEPVVQLAAAAQAEGDPAKGAALFYQPQMACIRCHSTGSGESPLGPDLAKLPAGVTAEHIVESLLAPSKTLRRGYEATILELDDGTALTAFVVKEDGERLVVRDVGQNGRQRTIARSQIAERQLSALSVMPTGQVNLLRSRQQFLDLAAYLIEISQHGPERAEALRPAGAPLAPPPIAPDTSGGELQVYRTLMPESGAASLAIGLGQGVWVCFDPQRGGINYAWRGSLDLSPTIAQKINQPASIEGELFFADATPVPLRSASGQQQQRVQFRGYRLSSHSVTLRYRIGDLGVNETVQALPNGNGFTRRFEFNGATSPVWLQVDPQKLSSVTCDTAVREENRFQLDLEKNSTTTMRVEIAGDKR